jgi:hypothetical protein
VTARDAVVFLAGANFGAAAYEYALGRLTSAFLGRRRASFDADWVPEAYLHDYYREVESDERATIAFFVDAVRRADPGRPMLFFGVGPTLHHVFLAAGTASELHLADYLPANLAAIQRWLDRDPDAHDWRPFVRYTLECEGVSDPSERQITDREELARAKITRLIQVDGRVPDPDAETYSTVVSAYCADSATSDLESWTVFMRNVMARVRPGGLFITAALRKSRGYAVGGKVFPSAGVDEHDVGRLLDADVAVGVVEVRDVPDAASHGYEGIVLARARGHEPALARRSA